MTYSCALWDQGNEDLDLDEAQLNKLDYHARQARVGAGGRVLDIGCGWGSGLRRCVETHGAASAHGLTLSEAQRAHIVAPLRERGSDGPAAQGARPALQNGPHVTVGLANAVSRFLDYDATLRSRSVFLSKSV